MALHRRCMRQGKGRVWMEGMLECWCRKAISHLRNEPSVLIPPAQQHLPFPCHIQQLQGWVLRSTAQGFLPPTAQLIPTDTLGVSRGTKKGVPSHPVQPCRSLQQHQDCRNCLDRADTGAAVLGRETPRLQTHTWAGGAGSIPRAHPMARLAAKTFVPQMAC